MTATTWFIVIGSATLVCLIFWAISRASKLRRIELHSSITIRTNRNEAYDFVRHQANFPSWSPFLAEDPTQTYQLKQTDGAVGGQYHWSGRGGKDLGYQEIAALTPGQKIEMRCHISKPFVAKPVFVYQFADATDGSVKISQVFTLNSALIDAFFLWLFRVKPQMAAMNQKGLELLRRALEQRP